MIIVPISSFPFPTKTTRIYPADALCGGAGYMRQQKPGAQIMCQVRSSAIVLPKAWKGRWHMLAPQIIQVVKDQFSIETHCDDWGSPILRNPLIWVYGSISIVMRIIHQLITFNFPPGIQKYPETSAR